MQFAVGSMARITIPFLALPEGLGGAMATTCKLLRTGIETTPRISTARKAPLLRPQEDEEERPAVRETKDEASLESNLAPERAGPQVAAMVEFRLQAEHEFAILEAALGIELVLQM